MQSNDKCIAIFKTFMKIGAFTFGGGYAMLPMIERSMVQQKKWITEEEMTDMVAISEATPGPIMVNLATFVGSKIAGVPGAIMATLGVIVPSFCAITIIAMCMRQISDMMLVKYAFVGIRAAVLVLVVKAIGVVYRGCNKSVFAYIIMGLALLLVAFFNANAIMVLIIAAILGIVYSKPWKGKDK